MNYGIVGAGRGAVAILEAFASLEGYRAVLVCDIDPDSPGMRYARKRRIPTSHDLADVGNSTELELVFELTGVPDVLSRVRAALRPDQQLVPSGAAKIIYDLIDAHSHAMVERSRHVLKRLIDVSAQISGVLHPIEESENAIVTMLDQANMITINASIEAARLGDTGRAFAVIINHLRELTGRVGESLELIRKGSAQIRGLSEGVRAMETSLDEELSA